MIADTVHTSTHNTDSLHVPTPVDISTVHSLLSHQLTVHYQTLVHQYWSITTKLTAAQRRVQQSRAVAQHCGDEHFIPSEIHNLATPPPPPPPFTPPPPPPPPPPPHPSFMPHCSPPLLHLQVVHHLCSVKPAVLQKHPFTLAEPAPFAKLNGPISASMLCSRACWPSLVLLLHSTCQSLLNQSTPPAPKFRFPQPPLHLT